MANETFDIAIGLHRNVINRALEKLYGQVYPKYFKGSAPADKREIFYDVKSAPKLDFSPTPGTAAALRAELEKLPQPENAPLPESPLLQAPMSLEAAAAAVESKTVKVVFENIDITIRSGAADAKTTASAIVWVHFTIEYPSGGKPFVKFTATKGEAKSPAAEDQFILNKVVVPAMLKLAAQLMSAIQLPDGIDVAGYRFDLPEPRIIGEYFVILAKTLDRHFPLGFNAGLPGGTPEAFVLLSPEFIWKVFHTATRDLTHTEEKKGSVDLGISTAYYHARIVASDIRGMPEGAEFPISASVRGVARGWITTFLGDPEANFSITPVPERVRASIALSADAKNKIAARVTNVGPLTFDVQPIDGAARVIDFVMWPMTLAIKASASGIANYIKGVSFDLWTLPDLPLSYDGITLKIRAKDLQLSTSGRHLQVTGGVNLL